MPIRTICPSCRTVYSLADHLAGKTVRCKSCGDAIAVRTAKPSAEKVASGNKEGARARIQARPPQLKRLAARDEEEWPRRQNRDDEDDAPPIRRDNQGLLIGLILSGVGLVLILGGGLLLAVLLFDDRSENKPPSNFVLGAGGGGALDNRAENKPPPDFGIDAGGGAAPANGDAVTRALHHLKSANAHERTEGARQLKDMLPDEPRRGEVVKALEPLLNEDNFFTRRFAIEALGVWGDKDVVPILLKAMGEKENRGVAMKTLGRLKDERAAEPIAERLQEFSDSHEAAEALKQMGPIAEKAVLARFNHHDLNVRITVCRILKAIGTKRSLPILEKAAKGGDRLTGENRLIAHIAKEAAEAIKARQ